MDVALGKQDAFVVVAQPSTFIVEQGAPWLANRPPALSAGLTGGARGSTTTPAFW